MIEYPPGSGRYVLIISPSQGKDLARPFTPEEWAQWELEDEWDNMIEGAPNWHVSDIRSF